MKVSPVEVREMPVSTLQFFMSEIEKDVNNKDPFLTPKTLSF